MSDLRYISDVEEDGEEPLMPEPYSDNLNLGKPNMGTISVESLRKYFFWSTQLLGTLIVCLTLIYIIGHKNGFGGRSDPKTEFNWHVFLMVLGFTYLLANSLTVFRLMPVTSKPVLKYTHLFLNGLVILCAGLGLFFVMDPRGILNKSHFTSLHSWIGIFTIALLVVQFISGAVVYLSPKISFSIKEALMPWHIKIGILSFLLGGAAIITGMKKGKTESETFLINITGSLVVIYSIFIVSILIDSKYKYNYRLR